MNPESVTAQQDFPSPPFAQERPPLSPQLGGIGECTSCSFDDAPSNRFAPALLNLSVMSLQGDLSDHHPLGSATHAAAGGGVSNTSFCEECSPQYWENLRMDGGKPISSTLGVPVALVDSMDESFEERSKSLKGSGCFPAQQQQQQQLVAVAHHAYASPHSDTCNAHSSDDCGRLSYQKRSTFVVGGSLAENQTSTATLHDANHTSDAFNH